MKLTPTIRTTSDLLRKPERENYRVLYARNALHKADHFLNFRITTDSMQDHLLEHLGQVQAGTVKEFRERWQKESAILAAADNANSTKHFVLRDKKLNIQNYPKPKMLVAVGVSTLIFTRIGVAIITCSWYLFQTIRPSCRTDHGTTCTGPWRWYLRFGAMNSQYIG
jgi:hypothetical protein